MKRVVISRSWSLILLLLVMTGCASGKVTDPDSVMSETDAACAELEGSHVTEGIDSGLFTINGESIDELAAFETLIQQYMWTYGMPNAGVAFVAADKRLVLRRSYDNACGGEVDERGWLVHEQQSSTPETRYRIGSISKVITATAVIAASEGASASLDLDDPLVNFVTMNSAADFDGDGRVDARSAKVDDITLEHLLRHRGGWNCDNKEDPIYVGEPTKSDLNIQAAYERVGIDTPLPITVDDIIGYGSGLPFAFDPGSTKNYCGFGYMLLEEVLASAMSDTYETAVHDLVLSKLGHHTFEQGRTLRSASEPDELIYHYHTNKTAPSVMAEDDRAPYPYGGAFNLENRFATGGWIGSPLDLVGLGWEFVHGSLVVDPVDVVSRNLGWGEDFTRAEATGHTGSLEGSHSILLCYSLTDPDPVAAGACWAVLFNRSPPREDGAIDPRRVLRFDMASAALGLSGLGTTEDYW